MAVGVAKRLDCASASNRQRQSHPIMKNGKDFVLTLVTAPNLETARKLAKLALDAHLIACANLVPRIESHYWWQGKIESSAEVLIVMKTAAVRLSSGSATRKTFGRKVATQGVFCQRTRARSLPA